MNDNALAKLKGLPVKEATSFEPESILKKLDPDNDIIDFFVSIDIRVEELEKRMAAAEEQIRQLPQEM